MFHSTFIVLCYRWVISKLVIFQVPWEIPLKSSDDSLCFHQVWLWKQRHKRPSLAAETQQRRPKMASASSARLEFVWVVRVDPISFLVDISIRKPQKISKSWFCGRPCSTLWRHWRVNEAHTGHTIHTTTIHIVFSKSMKQIQSTIWFWHFKPCLDDLQNLKASRTF